jgi:hypothetical protein
MATMKKKKRIFIFLSLALALFQKVLVLLNKCISMKLTYYKVYAFYYNFDNIVCKICITKNYSYSAFNTTIVFMQKTNGEISA